MESLKQKLLQLRQDLENSTFRAELAEDKLVAAKDRVEKAEESAGSLDRRIRNTQIQLDIIAARFVDRQNRLQTTENACKEMDEEIEVLVEEDVDRMEDERDLKHRIKEANEFQTVVQMEYEASLRKSKVMDDKRKQVEQREQDLSTQQHTLSDQLENLSENLKKLRKEKAKTTKKNELEKQFLSLKQKCLEADLRREATERKSQILEKELLKLKTEMDEIKATKNEAEFELRGLLDVLNTV